MEKFDHVKLIRELRAGETPVCPLCGKGTVSTENDPKTSHFFCCSECDFMVNID